MKNTCCILLIFCFTKLYSQDIISFKDKLLFKVELNKQTESFLINEENNNAFIAEANNVYKLKIAANYKFLGLSIGFSPSNSYGNNKSKFRNIQLRLFPNQWFQTIEHRRVQGFYQDQIPNGTALKQFPHLKTTSWTGSTAYVLNKNFSLKHLMALNEWQRETSGSFIPTLNYGFNRLSDFTENGKYIQNNFDIALTPNYYYTWIIKEHWFLSGNLAPSIGVRFSKEKIKDIETRDTFFTNALDFNLQFGYTTETISAGAKFSFVSNSNKEDNISRNFVNDKTYASLYFGYRFEPPTFIKNTANWIKTKTGL
ncbi:DUF4421 family protein [Lacinutrix sp. MedPE-SW]|uniref:DUF4421 family protein n=1 Tax=Lacinutrix sp. MedPE-SW TaxID=1860087 RepID=UPI0009207205|nr:DUF4421 family protein [Lacinutrix sp. MedPE-SW]OIQ22892.1 MAG: hypothetical protein BM549_05040 [Lacinutrix sp. MedPE-SW]